MKKPKFTYDGNENETYTIFKDGEEFLELLRGNEDDVLYLVSVLNSNYKEGEA